MSNNCYVALLRGINVSGKNSIRMSELQQCFLSCGLGEIRTYLQSGNVVFTTTKTDEAQLAVMLQNKIKDFFSFDIPVLVLSAQAFNSILKSNALKADNPDEDTLFHCTFLFDNVINNQFEELLLPSAEGECAKLLGQIVYLYCPNGYGNTKLNNRYFERALGVQATTRNWRTVHALQKLCDSVTKQC